MKKQTTEATKSSTGKWTPPTEEIFHKKLHSLGSQGKLNTPNVIEFLEQKIGDVSSLENIHDQIAQKLLLNAVENVKSGGFGISAAILNSENRIVVIDTNRQLQDQNTGQHAEMRAFDQLEQKYPELVNVNVSSLTGGDPYEKGLKLVCSTEPCPMCLVRAVIAGVPVHYLAPGGDDGMAGRVEALPNFWREQASEHKIEMMPSSPDLALIAHLLFFSFTIKDFAKCAKK